ncbi:cytochrome P450 [Phormidium sp. CCY1219]|uniref:cytochrome P450 n=1 Tax=Phormidium sp. CCY1219 TaxID=2886104 RepID=UPI002D771D29|nr:cytochrome P450 [Phormidium sp. CCY1219]
MVTAKLPMKVPGPQTPQLLQKLQWVRDPVGYMETASRDYPEVFAAQVVGFGNHLIFVNNPQAIKYILTHDTQEFFASGEMNGILKPLVGDYSVILLEGDRHRNQRKLLMPPFHGERMRAYGNLICDLSDKVMSQFAPGETFVARFAMQEISLQIILQAVFGLYEGERAQKIKQAIQSLLELFNSPLRSSFLFFPRLQIDLGSWSPWGYFQRLYREVEKLLYAEIEERRQHPDGDREDILSLLMSARDEAGNPMSNVELRDELLTLLFAGHETTATAMTWALYWVHHHPEVGEKLRAELATLEENPDPMSIFRLPYLTAVCNETLRIYPVAMLTFPRVVCEPMELLGYDLEPGTAVVGCIHLLHQREDLYPQPDKFKPERFLERQFSPYEFLPFGAGVRRCIGAALAQYEMKLGLATILSHYELALAQPNPVKPERRGVTLAPRGGVKMKFLGKTEKKLTSPATAMV